MTAQRICEHCGGANQKPRSRWCSKACQRAALRLVDPHYHANRRALDLDAARRGEAAYRAANREAIKNRRDVWRAARREIIAAQQAAWVSANREHARAYQAAWQTAHPEVVAAYGAAWRAANREHVRVMKATRRARESAAPGDGVTLAQWEDIKADHDHRCAYCGEAKLLTMDHVVPLSRGGAHDVANILPACGSCNSSKGARLFAEWKEVAS